MALTRLLCVPPQSVTLYGSSMLGGAVPAGQPLEIEGASQPGAVTNNGLVLYGTDGKAVSAAGTQMRTEAAALSLCAIANMAFQTVRLSLRLLCLKFCICSTGAGEKPAV